MPYKRSSASGYRRPMARRSRRTIKSTVTISAKATPRTQVRQAVAQVRRHGLAQLVRRIANRGVEVKHVGQEVVNADFNSTISSPSECYRLLPDVTEGTDGHQRIGDRIKPKYLVVHGKLHYSADVMGGGASGDWIPPSTVRILILSQKNIKSSTDISSRVDTAHLLKDNVGTDVARAYSGTQFDNLAPINKDLFTVYMDKKVKMKAFITKQLGNNNTAIGFDTNKTYMFTAYVPCPAGLTFDDGNVNTPNNFAPFLCLGGVNDDSSTPWTVTTPYHVSVLSTLYFTDA